MIVMVKGDSRTFFSRNAHNCQTFEEAVRVLRANYYYRDNQGRLLSEWQNMFLTKAMYDRPNVSDVTIFTSFVVRAMYVQRKLDGGCQGDKYLKERLREAVDITRIQASLK